MMEMPYDKSRWNVKNFGCSLPKPLLKELDIMRGDVNRSRYIQRLIEKELARTKK